ncbi:MAG: mannonate dehydratase [Anaerolineae bacterium]
MYLGDQAHYDESYLQWVRQLGVTHVDIPSATGLGIEQDGFWHVDALQKVRETVEKQGLVLAAMHLPLTSAGIEQQVWPNIMLGTPERDRDIDKVARSIEAAGKAGVPLLLYNLALLPVLRTGSSSGRGGVVYSHFDYRKLPPASPLVPLECTAEVLWERISYFIERIIPVAETSKVKLGCHQHDPALPPGMTYRGVTRILGSIEGVRRFVALSPSPYHGLNFCQGTMAEMCTDPEQLYAAIREFGAQKRIFWVHFRNIRGGLGLFDEVFQDDGNIDMQRAFNIYREVGYEGVLVPDHMPHIVGDTPNCHAARAYCFGYIRALIEGEARSR